ncbi:MAG: hypothetical protein Q4G58_14265 [bacterium]|nr:hypothetical protein [bacterium]
MEFVYLFIGLLLLLLVKSFFDQKKHNETIRANIRETWGKTPTEEYSEKKMEFLKAYYFAEKEADTDLDDITWNDLNLDEIYKLLNHTSTSIGEEYLYAMLRKLSFDKDVLQERGKLAEYFSTHEKEREDLQFAMRQFGKLKDISIYEYINRTDNIEVKRPWMHYVYALAFFVAIGVVFIHPGLGAIAVFAVLANNIIRYNVTKATISGYFNVFSYLLRMIEGVEMLGKTELKGLEEYTDQLQKDAKAFRKFKRGAGIVLGGRSVVSGISEIFLDYVRMIFHIDIIKFNNMLRELRANKQAVNRMYELIGLLDATLAIASFRELTGTYTKPELVESKKPFMEVTNVYHPLITNPVKNSIYQSKPALITGSNASGKSTFLRTVAINAVLSQTIYTSLSDSYKGSYFKVYSSMALSDSLLNNESYYMAEIKSLKRILDQMDKETPILCFVDEVLRGTNTIERISASAEILKNIAAHNVLCMAATHDIELTNILEDDYTNYHFQEEVKENDVLFDYKLYQGKARSKNAIKLLGMIGYDRSIIDAANKRANTFLETGEWTK